MNERALAGFVKIVELGSVTAAAEALFLSQSALSQQIKTLENHLQFALFQHGGRQVQLTAAGRAFYPKAKQMLALYSAAVQEAQAIARNVQPPARHLLIACQNLSLANFCYDLFALSPDRCLEFAPLAWHCPNRTEVWRSLKTGETDLSFQFECSEIPARGLRFTPLVYRPELCIPYNQNRPLPPGALSLEEAMCSRWIFANSFEPVLYEEELTREALSRGAEIVRGRDIPCSQYGLPTLMLTPSLFYPRPNLELVRPLGWGSGCRLGIVTRAEPDQMVLQYIQEIQPVIRTHRSQLFGLV